MLLASARLGIEALAGQEHGRARKQDGRLNASTLRDLLMRGDQGDQLALATGLDPQDTKAVLGVLVGDALDQSSEDLAIRWPGLSVHDRHHNLAVRHWPPVVSWRLCPFCSVPM